MEGKKARLAGQDIIVIGLLLTVVLISVFLLIEVRTYREELQTTPLILGAKKYNIDICSCSAKGRIFWFNQTSIWQIQKAAVLPTPNFSLLS